MTLSSVVAAATLVGLVLCAGASAGFAGANGAIAFVRDDGSSRTLVTLQGATETTLPVLSPVNHPAWSPDGSKLAYDDGAHVHVVNANGTELASPVSFDGVDPSWSPDGARIAYVDAGNVKIVNADKSPGAPAISVAGTQPAWSPDGSSIAYVTGSGDIDVRALTGADTNLTNSGAADSSPAWSPDGSHIVFVSDRDHPGANTELYAMNADGSNQMRLSPSTLGAASPSWSPDGTRIVFSKPDSSGKHDLWAFVIADSSLTQVTTNPVNDVQPDWQSAFSVRQPTIDAPNGTADGAQVTALLHGYTGAAPPTSYAYQWQRCSSAGTGCTAIADATDSTYTLTSLDVDSTVRVVVTGTSAAGTASATSPASTVVTAVAPSNIAVPTITGAVTAAVGTALTTDTGTWQGTTPISFSYQWLKCDGNGASCAAISGATGASYTPVDGDVGSTLRVRVTANNGIGADPPPSSTSGATVPVASSAPANVVAPSVNGDAEIGDFLFATIGTWSGAPTITYSYQWQRCPDGGNCNDIPGATTSSYTIVSADLNQRLRVQIKATNGSGSSTASSDQTDKVVGVTPSNSIQPFISGSAASGETLFVSPGSWLGAPTSYTYEWRRCSANGGSCVTIAGATTSSYVVATADVGSTLLVVVTAKNATGSGQATSNRTDTVTAGTGGTRPTNTRVPTVTGTVAKGKRLTAHAGTWGGAPPLTFTFQWERCPAKASASPVCVAVARATKTTYTPVAADVGKRLRVVVTAKNSGGSTSTPSKATVVVRNAAAPKAKGKRMLGTARTDRLVGSAAADLIRGGAGNDHIDGRAGNDRLYGDSGNDSIVGGAGPDSIFAGGGNDVVSAADGARDVIDCGSGDDRVTADAVDVLRGCEHVTRKP